MSIYIIKKSVRDKYGNWYDKWIAQTNSKTDAIRLVEELRSLSNSQLYSYYKLK